MYLFIYSVGKNLFLFYLFAELSALKVDEGDVVSAKISYFMVIVFKFDL